MLRARTAIPAATCVLTIASVAHAHIEMTFPTPRYSDQTSGPCGSESDARTENVATFAPGETITVTWNETVNHPAHYRIAFDSDGQDDFADPITQNDYYTNDAVLRDNLADEDGGSYSVEITLPDIECDNCTLQLIQVSQDRPPYGDGNDIYYQCADLVLSSTAGVADAGPDAALAFADAGNSDAGLGDGDGGGCCRVASASVSTGNLLLALVTLLLIGGRRRRR